MVAVIVLLDQLVWRPVIAWTQKFKVEQVESTDAPTSCVLDLLRQSRAIGQLRAKAVGPIRERLLAHFARLQHVEHSSGRSREYVHPYEVQRYRMEDRAPERHVLHARTEHERAAAREGHYRVEEHREHRSR
jgi:hypothetical protein